MYNQIIEKFIAAQRTARQAYQDAAQFEREALASTGAGEPFFAVGVRSEYRQDDELEKFCFALAGNVVSRARREFAPVGARLDIDNQAEFDRAGLDIGKALKKGNIPDVDQLWASLSAYYNGDGGATTAYRQAAARIVRGFGLHRNAEVKRTASGVVLKKSVHSEAGWKSARRRVGYYSTQPTADCLSGLATFAGKAGNAVLASMLQRIDLHQLEYTSREKMSMPGLDITLYNDKWEFKFSHELAEPLMLFVGEYGQDAMQERH
ncbi:MULTISPECIES: hypothetical protein [Cupriavidus]|uniref:Uncharacterized protein n=3 Tax=Cupriavidus TaxID=106589 RepID=A0A375DCV6_9BURK|nr:MULTISPECIES: hypothetical protein [Cupriavidus]MCO4865732.1 hypothetical protein [Cupriavidus sp. WGlv3]MCO4893375.1 hypothetical protein [Cupriavidus sp. WGtm5]ULX56094.1 hypothetical protein A9P79_29465 [Cupriavidus taiwanensis]CAP63845.1 conserved hypothetical protein [Cupriavidus taiwanensis LMG 19424]SOY74050.1 conserved hypothetical protein [Cupriavidus taiwanensis]